MKIFGTELFNDYSTFGIIFGSIQILFCLVSLIVVSYHTIKIIIDYFQIMKELDEYEK